jgi:hypothetical protein
MPSRQPEVNYDPSGEEEREQPAFVAPSQSYHLGADLDGLVSPSREYEI